MIFVKYLVKFIIFYRIGTCVYRQNGFQKIQTQQRYCLAIITKCLLVIKVIIIVSIFCTFTKFMKLKLYIAYILFFFKLLTDVNCVIIHPNQTIYYYVTIIMYMHVSVLVCRYKKLNRLILRRIAIVHISF